jgi:hypothetical protein
MNSRGNLENRFFLVSVCRQHVSISAHAGPKLLAATGRLLLANPRWAQHLSRAGESEYSGCGAHPNQPEGFAWGACWRSCRMLVYRRLPYLPGMYPRGATARPPQRSVLIRASADCPALPLCLRQHASQNSISPRCRLVFHYPRFRPRTNRGSRGKFRTRQQLCKGLCEILRREELSER